MKTFKLFMKKLTVAKRFKDLLLTFNFLFLISTIVYAMPLVYLISNST